MLSDILMSSSVILIHDLNQLQYQSFKMENFDRIRGLFFTVITIIKMLLTQLYTSIHFKLVPIFVFKIMEMSDLLLKTQGGHLHIINIAPFLSL